MATFTKTVEVHTCDACGTEGYVDACLGCGAVEHCWRCQDSHGHKYSHGAFASGHGDGYYCNICDADRRMNPGADKLHGAYLRVEALRDQRKAFDERWDAERKRDEKEVKRLYDARQAAGAVP